MWLHKNVLEALMRNQSRFLEKQQFDPLIRRTANAGGSPAIHRNRRPSYPKTKRDGAVEIRFLVSHELDFEGRSSINARNIAVFQELLPTSCRQRNRNRD